MYKLKNSFANEESTYFLVHAMEYLRQFEPQTVYREAKEKLHESLSVSFEQENDDIKNLLKLKDPEGYIKQGLLIIETNILPRSDNMTVGEILNEIIEE